MTCWAAVGCDRMLDAESEAYAMLSPLGCSVGAASGPLVLPVQRVVAMLFTVSGFATSLAVS